MNELNYILEDEEPDFETIGDTVYLMSPIREPYHIYIMGNLHFEFRNYFKRNNKKCLAYTGSLAWYHEGLNSKKYVKPDLSVICDLSKISKRGLEGVPELVVEILSPGTREYDRSTKKDFYENKGVKEYWIIDPKISSVEQYVLDIDKYKLHSVTIVLEDWEYEMLSDEKKLNYTTVVRPTIFEDCGIDLIDIF
ncbi:MAG: Uma2 family endonuclease [Oscillospiraceae bacterium]|nr:Uma2 family endonuclease [Oscillospiraceae bacterium]